MANSDATDASESILFKPAVLNFLFGLVSFFATAAIPALIVVWSDVRMHDRDLGEIRLQLADLEEWRRDASGFSVTDGRRLAERVAAVELWLAKHEASAGQPAVRPR